MERTLDDERLFQATKAFILNTTINSYAVERVAFGYEKPGDIAPIDLYLKHIFIGFAYEPQMRKDIPGVYIDENEHISAKQGYAEYVHDLFVLEMERIFFDTPKDRLLVRAGKEIPILPRCRDYLFKTEPLFAEVLNVKVQYNAFDVIPTNKAKRTKEYCKWWKLVTDILLEPLRSGSKINKYVKDITDPPHYIRRLIEKKGKNYYLKPIDMDSYEYIFALFSLILFKNDENSGIFELKMFEWERRYHAAHGEPPNS